jgi:D-lactate dehydrogenase (cytochrome)
VRDQHGKDTTWNPGHAPDAVAFVNNTEEVQKVVQACARYEVPVIAHGTGTSLEGHITAPHGGICINVKNMNQVLEVNTMDFDVRVQPGVTRKQLNEYIRDQGLFFPIDPGADASLGGMTPHAPPAPTRCATAPCATTCCPSPASCPMARSCAPRAAPRNHPPATT